MSCALTRSASIFLFATTAVLATRAAELAVSPHAVPSWELEFSSTIRAQRVNALGHLVVQTDAALYGVDPGIGKIAWSSERLRDLDLAACDEVASTPILFCDPEPDAIVALDASTGVVVFDSRRARSTRLAGTWPAPGSDGLLVLVEHAPATAGDDSRAGGPRRGTLALHELSNGAQRWRHRMLLAPRGGALAEPFAVASSFLVASGDLLQRIDAATGALVWRVARPGMGARGRFFVRSPDGPVVWFGTEHTSGPHAGTTSYTAHDLATGAPAWNEPLHVAGPLEDTFFLDRGLVVGSAGPPRSLHYIDERTGRSVWGRGGSGVPVPGPVVAHDLSAAGLLLTTVVEEAGAPAYRLNILDPTTGAPRFDRFVGVRGRLAERGSLRAATEGFAPARDGGWYAFSQEDGAVYRVGHRATPARLSRSPIFLEDAESSWIEPYGDGVLLGSPQELVGITATGEVRFHVHYPVPADAAVRAPLDAALASARSVEAAVPVSALPDRFRDLALHRQKASGGVAHHVYMVVALGPGTASLARVSKDDGTIVERIDLAGGDWQLDPVSHRVFLRHGATRIVGYGS